MGFLTLGFNEFIMLKKQYDITNKELFNMLIGRPGGKTTLKIIDELLLKPQNAHQLSIALGLNYKTITYHLDILCKYKYVTKEKFNSYYYYFPNDKLIKILDEYRYIKEIYQNE